MYLWTQKYIATSNQEGLGKQMLYKGCSFIARRNFAAAFSYISDGYELLTCDCTEGDWFAETHKQREEIIQLSSLDINEPEFHFCLAFALLYIALADYYAIANAQWPAAVKTKLDSILLAKSLAHINRYLADRDTYLGFYLKGRILAYSSGNQEINLRQALACLDTSFKLKVNNPALFSASRLRELLKEDALFGLYSTCLSNPSSVCAWRNLHEAAIVKRGIVVDTTSIRGHYNFNTTLLKHFNSAHFYYFQKQLSNNLEAVGVRGTHGLKQVEGLLCSIDNDHFIRASYGYASMIHRDNKHLQELQDFVFIMTSQYKQFNQPEFDASVYVWPETTDSSSETEPDDSDSNAHWGEDVENNPYYNDNLDMDQQGQEFWDNL